jgi:methionyl-tRNA formyltransferase
MVYLFCAYREWSKTLFDKLKKNDDNIVLLKSPKKLTFSYVKKINPEMIFFPDWSWIVNKKIINNYKCVCFHESNLPKFRGGSPLQNQIIRGVEKTKTTAFIMNEGLDEGVIMLQKELSLKGSINEIFKRMINNDYVMIKKIMDKKYKLKNQKGKPTKFKRRSEDQSELTNLDYSKKYIYNFIRMLDDPYPNAFIQIGKRKIVFKNISNKNNKLIFSGEIQ